MAYDYLRDNTDEQLAEHARQWARDNDPEDLERVEAFAARYGEKALALYPVIESVYASAHGDCITPEGSDSKVEEGRCWGVPETELDRLARVLGITKV